jgi:hypothetical protein
MNDYDITSNTELDERVRAETGYEDTPDELPQSDLETLRANAKLVLATDAGVDDGWYTDRGLGLALLGVTCVKAKARVENYSVSSWSLGGGDVSIEVEDSDGSSIQMTEYENMIQMGMARADDVDATLTATNINSASYIG